MLTHAILALSGVAITFIVIAGILLLLIVMVIGIYNGLVALRNRVKNAWAQIDVQLKRRYDLIPNLVETAKGYMKHERETLEAVTNARNQAMAAAKAVSANPTDGGAVRSLGGAEGALRGALGNLTVAMEAYPDLKANTNMLQVQEELTSTENKVAFSRQAYNDSVMRFNNAVEQFPSSIIAGMAGFKQAEFFEIDAPEERKAVKVQF